MAVRERMRNDVVEVELVIATAPATRTVEETPLETPHTELRDLKKRQETPTEILPPEITEGGKGAVPTKILIDDITKPTTTSIPSSSTAVVTPTTAPSQPTAGSGSNTTGSGGDEGVSVAVKAGIAMGVLAGLLVIFVLVWLIMSMRKKKQARRRQQIEDDEKIHGPFSDSAAIARSPPAASSAAPRLSLRPVSNLWQNLAPSGHPERRASRGIQLTVNPAVSSHSPTNSLSPLNRPNGRGGSAWERPTMNSTTPTDDNRPGTQGSVYSLNPFHDSNSTHNNSHYNSNNHEPVSPVSTLAPEFPAVPSKNRTPTPEPVSPIDQDTDLPEFGAGSKPLARKTSINHHNKGLPKPLDLTKPPSPLYAPGPASPAGTEYSMHSMAPSQVVPSTSAAEIAAAGGPQNSTVHRVQLDFKPTLDDELGLKAGQLVRLLHEYDDGWALCIRLDRSKQGVVPRTCLSTRPVKPRGPQNGPRINPTVPQGYGRQNAGGGLSPRMGGFPSPPAGSNNGWQSADRSESPGSFYSTQGGPSPVPQNGRGESPYEHLPGGLSPAPGQAY
ncbi:hypothetical protein QBC40DRAFT_64475 [Triangularia verruculosa]|uniref:SH3 domain-containing protein n=1 Tax=Triangularia verruculosa TaxID=2587418 RepID=A0AAN6XHV4_9PEZI|nr:hypothetical protein QBC40DRAFT_64475 [Triangularia verruculosa]